MPITLSDMVSFGKANDIRVKEKRRTIGYSGATDVKLMAISTANAPPPNDAENALGTI